VKLLINKLVTRKNFEQHESNIKKAVKEMSDDELNEVWEVLGQLCIITIDEYRARGNKVELNFTKLTEYLST
jgi:SOS-response transcriptional repressor LexA